MARSIHTTRRHIEESRRWDVSDSEHRDKLISGLEGETAVKRRVKSRVRRERAVGGELLPPTDIELIPIVVKDNGPCIHYPASADDIRHVMRLLPGGVLDGLNGVELCLGADRQDEDSGFDQDEPDPHTGRIGRETLPGVFSGRVLAVYTSGECVSAICDCTCSRRWCTKSRTTMISRCESRAVAGEWTTRASSRATRKTCKTIGCGIASRLTWSRHTRDRFTR